MKYFCSLVKICTKCTRLSNGGELCLPVPPIYKPLNWPTLLMTSYLKDEEFCASYYM